MKDTEDCAGGDKDGEENVNKGDDTPGSQEASTSTAVVASTSQQSVPVNSKDCKMLPLQCHVG